MAMRAQWLRRCIGDRQGIAVVEFALALPVLMTLFYGVIEITRYILIAQKVEKLAHSVADVTAQSQTVSLASLDQVMAAASDIMSPYNLSTNGRIIVSSLYRAAGVAGASVSWRYTGGGSLTAASNLGALGTTPSMPAGFTFEERENVIAAEVFYQFSPLISNQFFGTTTIYRVAFYKPRLGALIVPPA
jgi:Flp pilus assembly protein TadG